MGGIKTYNPKEVIMSLGSHMVTGYADDSFISVDPNGDGVTKKIGCDGEIVRSISPDDTFVIKLSLLYSSDTSSWLQNKFSADIANGSGMFPILIRDLNGNTQFTAAQAWVAKPASRGFGKEAGNREWEIHTGSGSLTE